MHDVTRDPSTDVVQALADLKSEIRRDVNAAIARCYTRVGLSPSDVRFEMTNITTTDDRLQHHIVDGVRLRFDEV